MKASLIILLTILTQVVKSQTLEFDSLKVYSKSFYSESPIRIDKFYLMVTGDSATIYDKEVIRKLNLNLKNLVNNKNSKRSLKRLRMVYKPDLIDVRTVFLFFKGTQVESIGISPHSMIFINDLLFERNDRSVEDAIANSKKIYEMMFPTR